ncbi:efflux RND transporter periplasmic adaptor subunit [Kiloniella sp. b19]|uniref:efflux RND transporter periplasmic adaptor subunit n=1 Tax=Kiloniella sp. GXU_MW_B19 TaxID=3141326 RepID=UPI0031D586D2
MSVSGNKKKLLLATGLVVALGALGAGIYSEGQTVEAADAEAVAQAAPPAVPVAAIHAKAEPVQIWSEYSSRLEAVDFAEIRPQVSGTITDVLFEDGQAVEKGEVLFVIDPKPYEAAVAQARAGLSSARNQASFASKQLKRAQGLINSAAISERLLDERKNEANVSHASVKAAEARLIQAEIDLDRAYVKAPISGHVSRAEITRGNLVEGGGSAPVLTSIVSNDGIYAAFDVDEQTYLNHIRTVGTQDQAEADRIPVRLTLGSSGQLFEGFVHSFDNRIDATSGTIRARAYFANRDGMLLPGMFGTVQIGSARAEKHILISETAIGTNQDRKFVYVVDAEGKAAYREVLLGERFEGKRIVTKGLNDGDVVITEGLMRIRPSMPVDPQFADKVASAG